MSSALAPLWQIEEHLQALLDSIETCPDDLKPEIQADIDAYLGHEVAKIDHVAHVLAALDYEQKCAGDEITRLQERKKAAKVAQDRLEQYVCRVIKMRGVSKLAGKTNTLSVRPSDAVKVVNLDSIPEGMKTVAVTMPYTVFFRLDWAEEFLTCSVSADKAAIKRELKAGNEVPGADLEFRDNLIRK